MDNSELLIRFKIEVAENAWKKALEESIEANEYVKKAEERVLIADRKAVEAYKKFYELKKEQQKINNLIKI